jgi:Tol biopolymer transport system component
MQGKARVEQVTRGADRQMHPSISANGELVYVNAQIRQDVYETQTGNAADARRLTSFGTVSSFQLSANGRVLLFPQAGKAMRMYGSVISFPERTSLWRARPPTRLLRG